MTKPKNPTLDQQERGALADLWARVVLDDNAHDDDKAAARTKLARPTLTDDMLASLDLWKLAALRALFADETADRSVIALGHRIKAMVTKS